MPPLYPPFYNLFVSYPPRLIFDDYLCDGTRPIKPPTACGQPEILEIARDAPVLQSVVLVCVERCTVKRDILVTAYRNRNIHPIQGEDHTSGTIDSD